MMISYWYCDYADPDELNVGTDEDPEYEWHYGCIHEKSNTGVCLLENKYDDEDDCSLIGEEQNEHT